MFVSIRVVIRHRPMRLRTLEPPPRPRLERPPRLRPPLDPRERRLSAGKSSAEFSREIDAELCPPPSPLRLFARRSPSSSSRPSFASSSRSRLRPPLGLESDRSLDLSRLRLAGGSRESPLARAPPGRTARLGGGRAALDPNLGCRSRESSRCRRPLRGCGGAAAAAFARSCALAISSGMVAGGGGGLRLCAGASAFASSSITGSGTTSGAGSSPASVTMVSSSSSKTGGPVA